MKFAVYAAMNLKVLSDWALLSRASELARDDRRITLEILHHLLEIERRKLFAELGYSSLFVYCVRHLGYDEASAQRRVSSMRLLKEIPELEEKIQQGKFSISTLAIAQVFFKKEAKIQTLKIEDKREIIEKLSGKSKREVECTLLSLSSNPEIHLKEKTKVVTPTKVEMTFFADMELQEILEKIRGVLAHKFKSGTLSEVIAHIAKEYWLKIDPGRSVKSRLHKFTAPEQVRNDTIPAAVKRAVWKRDDGRCSYTNSHGQKCGSRYRLQFDHYPIPYARGGSNTQENLRLTCYQHNALHAVKSYGLKKVEKYWNKTI